MEEHLTIEEKLDLILEELNYLNRNVLRECTCDEDAEEYLTAFSDGEAC